jgi:hypothetical protein
MTPEPPWSKDDQQRTINMALDDRDYINDRYLDQEGIKPEDPRPIVLKQSFNNPRFSLSEKEKEKRLKALQNRFKRSTEQPKPQWLPIFVTCIWGVAICIWTVLLAWSPK